MNEFTHSEKELAERVKRDKEEEVIHLSFLKGGVSGGGGGGRQGISVNSNSDEHERIYYCC